MTPGSEVVTLINSASHRHSFGCYPYISENVRGWKGPLGPTLLPKQGHPEQAAQDCVRAGFEYLQRRRLLNPSRQPVPVLCHSQSK